MTLKDGCRSLAVRARFHESGTATDMWPVDFFDRPWTSWGTVTFWSPVRLPALDALRAAIREVVERDPRSTFGSTLDLASASWRRVPPRHLDDHIERIVAAAPEPAPGRESDFVVANLAPTPFTDPIRMVFGTESVAFFANHAHGDALTNRRMYRALLTADPDLILTAGERIPARVVFQALAAQCLRSPRNAVRLLRSASGVVASPPSGAAAPWATSEGWVSPTPEHTKILARSFPTAVLDDLAEWRRVHAPTASIAAIMASTVFVGLLEAGVPMDPTQVHLMFDARRYLPGRHRSSGGNLARGISLAVDPADPVAVAAGIRGVIERFLPLSTLVAAALADRKGHVYLDTGPAPAAPVKLIFSWVGQDPGSADTPWLPDRERLSFGVSNEAPPGQLSVIGWRTGDRVIMNTMVDGRCIDAEKVAEGLDSLFRASSLLSEPGRPR